MREKHKENENQSPAFHTSKWRDKKSKSRAWLVRRQTTSARRALGGTWLREIVAASQDVLAAGVRAVIPHRDAAGQQ